MTDSTNKSVAPGKTRARFAPAAQVDEAMPEAFSSYRAGFASPLPEQLSSGRRRHVDSEVARLRLVAQLVSHGEDPRGLMGLSMADLGLRAAQADHRVRASSDLSPLDMVQALRHIESYDADGLLDQLLEVGSARSATTFVEEDLGPLLVEIGQRWSLGQLDICQEHLATTTIQSLLHQLKARMKQAVGSKHGGNRVTVLLAGLMGERHELPQHLVAYVAELAGARCIVAGGDESPASIAHSATLAKADIVGIHTSWESCGSTTEAQLEELKGALPDSVQVLVGGAGCGGLGELPEGVKMLSSLAGLEEIIADLLDC